MPTELLPAIGSGAQDANAQIYTGACKLTALGVFTNGSDDFQVALYDGTADTHKLLWICKVTGANHYGGRVWLFPDGVNTGIYAAVTGSNGQYVVEYLKVST